MRGNRSGWTVGADRIAPRDWSGEVVQMPSGWLHAVSGTDLIVGRALCLAPVTLPIPTVGATLTSGTVSQRYGSESNGPR